MKRFSLKKVTGDVYAFCAALLLTASLFAWTNIYNTPKANLVVLVSIQGEVADRLPLDVNATKTYYNEIFLSEDNSITIEIKDGKVRVSEETSPLKYCSIQGFVDKPGFPIVCAPNYFMVVIAEDVI